MLVLRHVIILPAVTIANNLIVPYVVLTPLVLKVMSALSKRAPAKDARLYPAPLA